MKLRIPAILRAGALYKPFYVGHEGSVAAYRDELLGLPWLTVREARHEYFMSDRSRHYTYGNRGMGDQGYDSVPFTPMVNELRAALRADVAPFNVCFLNKYDNERQHLGWHADDHPDHIPGEPIAVVSFGAERQIWVKPKVCQTCRGSGLENEGDLASEDKCPACGGSGQNKGEVPDDQRITLEEGSLFIMPPGYQDTHLHRIPKHDRPCGWRISLTFRCFA